MSQPHFRGGCLCGSVRYAASAPPFDAGYCHCRMCQRSSGAPVLPWATFPTGSFAYEKGKPSVYHSSENGRRDFCGGCGTQLAFRDLTQPERVDVNMGTLDAPESITPEYHIWTSSRISWFDLRDELPRFEEAGPDRPAT